MIKNTLKFFIQKLGYDIVAGNTRADFENLHNGIIEKVTPYTMTSPERIYTLIESVRYVLKNDIKGEFVECGVWKGGSMMAIALTLLAEGITDKELYLFDTFEGMPEPDARDINIQGKRASDIFSKHKKTGVGSTLSNASLESVKQVMSLTGYPMEKIHFVKGLVEDTIPQNGPNAISLLRLDTDWYQSTKHELAHLHPNVSSNGIVIIDDYGHCKGAKDAVDEYFQSNKIKPFLHRIDYTGRLIIKN